MSSIRTRMGQRIKETFNKKRITHDVNFDTVYADCEKVEGAIKYFVTFVEHFSKSLAGVEYFCTGMGTALPTIYDKSSYHRGPILQIAEVHQSMLQWHSDATARIGKLLEDTRGWFAPFDEVRATNRQRDKSRLVYDHYMSKLDGLRSSLAKKKSRNPTYVESTKESERISRNQRKLATATENFKADSNKCLETIYQAMESRYMNVTPCLANLVGMEVDLYKRTAAALATLKTAPEQLIAASRSREQDGVVDEYEDKRQQLDSQASRSVRAQSSAVMEKQFDFNSSGEEDVGGFLSKPPAQKQDFRGDFATAKGDFGVPKSDFAEPKGDFRGQRSDFAEPKGDYRGQRSDFAEPKGDHRAPKPMGDYRTDFGAPKGGFKDDFAGDFGGDFGGPKSDFKGDFGGGYAQGKDFAADFDDSSDFGPTKDSPPRPYGSRDLLAKQAAKQAAKPKPVSRESFEGKRTDWGEEEKAWKAPPLYPDLSEKPREKPTPGFDYDDFEGQQSRPKAMEPQVTFREGGIDAFAKQIPKQQFEFESDDSSDIDPPWEERKSMTPGGPQAKPPMPGLPNISVPGTLPPQAASGFPPQSGFPPGAGGFPQQGFPQPGMPGFPGMIPGAGVMPFAMPGQPPQPGAQPVAPVDYQTMMQAMQKQMFEYQNMMARQSDPNDPFRDADSGVGIVQVPAKSQHNPFASQPPGAPPAGRGGGFGDLI